MAEIFANAGERVTRMPCLGIDYDATIADTNFVKATWIRDNLGLEVSPWQCDRTTCVPIIGVENYEAMSSVVYERDYTLVAPPIAGALGALRTLSLHSRVYIITARPPCRIAFAKTWLEQHGAADTINNIFSFAASDKQTLCREYGVNVLIDDDVRHLAHLSEQGARAILFKPGVDGEFVIPAGVTLCRSWDEVMAAL